MSALRLLALGLVGVVVGLCLGYFVLFAPDPPNAAVSSVQDRPVTSTTSAPPPTAAAPPTSLSTTSTSTTVTTTITTSTSPGNDDRGRGKARGQPGRD